MVRVRASTGAAAPLLPTVPAFLRLQAARRGAAGGLAFRGRAIAFGELAEASRRARALARPSRGRRGTARSASSRATSRRPWRRSTRCGGSAPSRCRSRRARRPRSGAAARATRGRGAPGRDAARADVAREAAALGRHGVPWSSTPDLPLSPTQSCARRPRAGRRGAAARPAPQSVAAIAYTSGSTGAPKGVRADAREPALGDARVRAGARRRRATASGSA